MKKKNVFWVAIEGESVAMPGQYHNTARYGIASLHSSSHRPCFTRTRDRSQAAAGQEKGGGHGVRGGKDADAPAGCDRSGESSVAGPGYLRFQGCERSEAVAPVREGEARLFATSMSSPVTEEADANLRL